MLLSCCVVVPPPSVSCTTAQVNSLTSFETDIPYEYYSMPFCKPAEGIHRAGNAANLGTVIMGIKLENSQYNFTVMVRVVCVAKRGTQTEVPSRVVWVGPPALEATGAPAAAVGCSGCMSSALDVPAIKQLPRPQVAECADYGAVAVSGCRKRSWARTHANRRAPMGPSPRMTSRYDSRQHGAG